MSNIGHEMVAEMITNYTEMITKCTLIEGKNDQNVTIKKKLCYGQMENK